MNPDQTPNDPPAGADDVADRNVERLLAGAYQPEEPDPAFVEKTTAAMQSAAQQPAAAPKQRRGLTRRLAGWAVAATLLVGAGLLLGSILLGKPGFRREGTVVWINGRAYKPADSPFSGTPWREAKPDELAKRAELSEGPLGRTGMTARDRAEAPPAEALAVGGSLETAAGQRRRVTLADGSVLYLNQHTAVTLDQERHLTLRQGEIFVEVAPLHQPDGAEAEPASKFVVATPDRQITALGTKFNVRLTDEGTRVMVTQGKVRVSGMKLPVWAGQQLAPRGFVTGEDEAAITGAPRATHLLDWTKDLMARAESPLVPGSKYAGGALIAVDPNGQEAKLSLRKYHVDVHIEDGFARTTIDQTYFNHLSSRLEGTFYFPLPPEASLSRLAMYVGGKLMEGGMAERDHARRVFEDIVRKMKDPALLEWIDGSTFKMRVFPLEGRQEKRIILSYTQQLPRLYDRTQYRFPGGHSMQMVGQWSARIRVKGGARLRWESDSHEFAPSREKGDLVLDASANDVKPDRDVVLSLWEKKSRKRGPSADGRARFSAATHEGSKYLMLRWRPELPSREQHERRDWVFLFEASADRDPLLARVQVDVIKALLENAEHDDTFSILTAGTRVHAFRAKPQAATPKNVKKAVKFLEQTHLVGALDLGRALAATGPFVEAVENPYLVHVGSGLPVLGEKDVPALLRQIPEGARYVGVGVGKRWSRTLMKTAAGRTGGYFTQINPDEQVTWRAFDLLSTLNTPRLLNLGVADEAEQLEFLCSNDSLAHGEELCAITRFDDGRELPRLVELTGMIDGKPYSESLPVGEVAEGADYLPRIWAKLEIDRLVALGALENKARIIELSKAMYVMSPFTSLLVLENEEMYRQYNVDRGRKDHWALYPCPEQIPVVHEPLPSPPVRDEPERAAHEKPTAADVLSTVMVRIPPPILNWPDRPQRQTPYAVPILYRHAPAVYLYNGQQPFFEENGRVWIGTGLFGGSRGMSGMSGMGMGGMGGMGMSGMGMGGMGGGWGFDLNGNGDYDDILMFSVPKASWDMDNDGDRFWGDQVPAYSLYFSPDGRRLATSTDDSTVRIWQAWAGGYNFRPINWETAQWSAEVNRPFQVFGRVPPGGVKEAIIRGDFGIDLPPVQIETLEGLDVLVVRGNQRDVDRVTRIVREIERLGTETGPRPAAYPIADPVRRQQRMSQLMRQFNSLMDEGRYREGKEPGRNILDVEFDRSVTVGMQSPGVFSADLDIPFVNWLFNTTGMGRETESLMMMVTPRIIIQEEDDLLLQPPIVYPNAEVWRELMARRAERYRSMDLASRGPAEKKIADALKSPTQLEFIETPLQDVIDYLKDYHDIEIQIDQKALDDVGIGTDTPITRNLKGISLRAALRLMLRELELTYLVQDEVLVITTPEEFERRLSEREFTVALMRYRMKTDRGRQWLNYQQPSFQDHWAIYHDLLSYAPGMNTSLADVCAVLEAEARPDATPALGRIDEEARKLIKNARGHGWQTATISDRKGKPLLSVDFDGTGRYRYERTTGRGLREQVLCDGTHLWHLYPELGLGARRELSRFHRRQLAGLVPWVLPPAEDMARGADLVAVDDRTVAIVPQGIEEAKDEEGKPIEYARVQMLFDADGRLSERRLVERPGGKTLLRQTYAADGSMQWLDADGKVLSERKIALEPCGAPRLKPDDQQLVILPLPVRTLAHLQQSRNLALDGNYATWNEEDALAVVLTDLRSGRGHASHVLAGRFFNRGDRRLGLYALLAATYIWDVKEPQAFQNVAAVRLDPLADHPGEPLAEYIDGYLKVRRGEQEEFGPIGGPRDGLLQQLAEFRDLWVTFQSGRVKKAGKAELEQYRDRTLSLLRRCKSPELAWALLSIALDNDTFSGFYRHFGRSLEDFQNVPGLWYVARYEYARGTLDMGDWNQAQKLFDKLYTDVVERGFLPPIDSSFREAFQRSGEGNRRWRELMHQTSAKLISDGARPAAVRLAWQVHHLGDQPLAEELFDAAISGTPKNKRLRTTLAAVEYLWHTGQHPRADAMLRPLLDDRKYAEWPSLWRLASMVAESRGMTARALGCEERAMEIEYKNLPEAFDVRAVRNEYSQLLSRYQQLAAAIATLEAEPPREFLGRVIRAADRWRSLDTDSTAACQAAAKIFGDLGAAELAWDYLTTPLAAKPNEAAPWVNLAKMLRQQGHFELADRAYASAFDAEPTNAQILWDRAQVLLEAGRPDEAKTLLRQIADGQWQSQFDQLRAQAKQHAEQE